MDASIVVCTYNRASSLGDTIKALRALETPAGCEWEVLVVDNNSKDNTRTVVERAAASWDRLRYLFEASQGLSHARNRGIAEARGRTILFTDDDVLPEPDWLTRTLAGLDHYRADACGGYIAPMWERPPPPWLTERFYGFLAVRTDRVDDYRIGPQDLTPFGANMAFRRTVFDQVGCFDTQRGRNGAVLASGEDSDMFDRILRSGLKVVFLGGARVHHKVEAYRATKRYFRRWRLQTSRNQAQSQGLEGSRRLFNIPYFVFTQFARALGRMLWGWVSAPRDEAFQREMIVYHFIGLMQGLHRRPK